VAHEAELFSLAQTHMRQQVRDVAAVQAALAVAFDRYMDPGDLDGSFESFLRYAVTLISAGRSRGLVSADRFYRASRLLAELGATVPNVVAPVLNLAQTATALRVTGPVAAKRQIAKGVSPVVALQRAKVTMLASAKRQVLDAPRQRLILLSEEDDDARGWARVSDGSPCPFCAMLVARGPVYSRGTVGFIAHDGCGCQPRAVFRTDRSRGWDDRARRLRDLYDEDPSTFRSRYEASRQADKPATEQRAA
jgi:hypothetical protein